MTKRMKTAGPVNRNDDIALKIDSLGSEGQGVGRYEGLAVLCRLRCRMSMLRHI